ncbi:MAG: hypothetical protein ABIW30_01775 [Arenimonas sp.]
MLRSLTMMMFTALLVSGCNRAAENSAGAAPASAENPAPVQVVAGDDKTPSVVTAGNLKIQSGSGLSIPAEFPKDVYLPESKSIDNVTQIGPMTSMVLGLANPPKSLMHDIESQMKAQGWKTAMSMATGGEGAMMAFSKPERTAVYSLSLVDGKAELSLQHTQSAKN